MNTQFEHIYYSSFLLYLDNQILNQGQCYTNYGGLFYPINSYIQGQTAYSCGFRQICGDFSVSGAAILTGLYINNNFVTIGQSGLAAINYDLGNAYFTGVSFPANTIISGNFAVKDFNIKMTDEEEYNLIFNTKYQVNPMYSQNISGLDPSILVEPTVMVKFQESEYKPFAFTRVDDNNLRLRLIIITDNEYQRVGVTSIIKNLRLTWFPLVTQNQLDYLGNYTGIPYNYSTLPMYQGNTYQPWIMEAKMIQLPKRPFMEVIKDVGVKVALADISISTIMAH